LPSTKFKVSKEAKKVGGIAAKAWPKSHIWLFARPPTRNWVLRVFDKYKLKRKKKKKKTMFEGIPVFSYWSSSREKPGH
jgi:hypothetical protein